MSPLDRRQLVSAAAAGAASLALPRVAFASGGKRWRPNDDVRVAVVGIRSRGVQHIDGFHGLEGVRVVALCDCDEAFLAREVKRFEERGESVDAYVDVRRLLEREDIDVIATATPNHWHALITIWACQAGKDVYVEKPVSHDVWEGDRMVAAARRYGRIVQTGTQSRSSQAIADAIAWLREGHIGKIRWAQGLCYKPRKPIGRVDGPQVSPPSCDYDLWTGPAPLEPLMRRNLHYDWHWVFDTGNGDLGNQGVHQVDLCRWALGHDRLSDRVLAIGGRLGYEDDGDTPNTMISVHEWDDGPPLVFEVRGLPTDAQARTTDWRMDTVDGVGIGAWIHCEGGKLLLPNYGSARAIDTQGEVVMDWSGARDHFANFVAAVRSRRMEDLTADIREGHLSSALCHTANASYLTGVAADHDEVAELVSGHGPAGDAFGRMAAHLEANGVDLEATSVTAGALLTMDPATERFTNSPAANRLLRSDYREPFVVPVEV